MSDMQVTFYVYFAEWYIVFTVYVAFSIYIMIIVFF